MAMSAIANHDDNESMNVSLEDQNKALADENKTLRGKIRGYQRLGQLFQELKVKHNRLLEMEQLNKQMVSVATETSPPASLGPLEFSSDIIPDPGMTNAYLGGITVPKENIHEDIKATPAKERQSLNGTNADTMFPSKTSGFYQTLENSQNPEENNFLLRRKLEDALLLVEEFERKRSNDKKLVKILNEELKNRKEELDTFYEKVKNLQQEKDLMMIKIAKLEHERDNLPLDTGAATTKVASEVEGVEDWVHLHQENIPENDYQVEQLKFKCKELEEKASRWENEHFNLQMESSKHVDDLRVLLEKQSKELVTVKENLNSEKMTLESKFKKLETMLQEEKDAKFEAYSMRQEIMAKYRILEKKFLALEEKNKSNPGECLDPKEIFASSMGPASSNNDEQISMLKQQLTIFKEDFEKERKECFRAQKQAKTFEEKLHNTNRELEKKDNEIEKYEKFLHEERNKTAKYQHRVSKLEKEYKMVVDHNHMLMELQSKMAITQPLKMKEAAVIPPCVQTVERPAMIPNAWSCKICTYLNDPQAENCNVCKAPKPSQRGQNLPRFTPRWKCSRCTYQNNSKSNICNMCKAPMPRPSSRRDETVGLTRRISKHEDETTEANLFDDDLTIDGPTTDDPPSENYQKL